MVIITLQHNLKGFKKRLLFALMLQLHSSTVFIQSICQSSQALKALPVRKMVFSVCLYVCLIYLLSWTCVFAPLLNLTFTASEFVCVIYGEKKKRRGNGER